MNFEEAQNISALFSVFLQRMHAFSAQKYYLCPPIMYTPVYNKRRVLKFTQFNNRGYSLFSVLGKEVIIGVLSVATLRSADAVAQNVSSTTLPDTTWQRNVEMNEVNITGTRAPLDTRQQARMVTVLRRSDIAAAPVQSVNDLLKYATGVDVRQKGPLGALTDVSIRGGNSEQIAILLNGINICDPQTGHNAMDLPVSVDEIERIEVLEGPAARVYGTSSLLGAINIVTRIPQKSSATVRAEGGSYGYMATSARGNVSSERWGNQLSASYLRSDGYLRNKEGALNSDYRTGKAFYQGRYDDPNVALRWQAGLTSKDYGANTYYSARYDNQFEHTLKTFLSLQGENQSGPVHFRPSIYWNHQEDRFELVRGSESQVPYNYHRTEVFGLNLNAYFDWTLGRTAFGAEARNEDIISTNLGDPLERKHAINGTDRFYTNGLNRTNLQFFLEHNVTLGRLFVSAGLTAVKNSQADMDWKVYPGVDMSVRLNRHWQALASYNASLRMPSFTELYYSVGGHKADSHLKPEELSAIEAGLRYTGQAIDAKASAFYNRHRNLIDWISDGETDETGSTVWKSVNFGHVNALGLQLFLQANMLRLLPGQRVVERLSVGYTWLNQREEVPESIVSQYALEYLKNKFSAQTDLRIMPKLTLRLAYRLQHRMGSYLDTSNQRHHYASYGVLDARLQWSETRWNAYLESNNLLNKKYRDYGNVPQPGIWTVAGVAFLIL